MHLKPANKKLKNFTTNIVAILVFILKAPINLVSVLYQGQKEKKPSVTKAVKHVPVEVALLKIKSSEKKRNVNVKDKKGKENSVVVLVKKNSTLKMDVVKNVFEHFLKIEKPVYARFLNQFERLNFLLKAANFVDAMDVIHVT